MHPIFQLSLRFTLPLLGMLPDLSFTEVKSMPVGPGLQILGPLASALNLPLALQVIFALWHFQKWAGTG